LWLTPVHLREYRRGHPLARLFSQSSIGYWPEKTVFQANALRALLWIDRSALF
jgi:hypothetical protein